MKVKQELPRGFVAKAAGGGGKMHLARVDAYSAPLCGVGGNRTYAIVDPETRSDARWCRACMDLAIKAQGSIYDDMGPDQLRAELKRKDALLRELANDLRQSAQWANGASVLIHRELPERFDNIPSGAAASAAIDASRASMAAHAAKRSVAADPSAPQSVGELKAALDNWQGVNGAPPWPSCPMELDGDVRWDELPHWGRAPKGAGSLTISWDEKNALIDIDGEWIVVDREEAAAYG